MSYKLTHFENEDIDDLFITIKNKQTNKINVHYANNYGYKDHKYCSLHIEDIIDDLELCSGNLEEEAFKFFDNFYETTFPSKDMRDLAIKTDQYIFHNSSELYPLIVCCYGSEGKTIHNLLRGHLGAYEIDLNAIDDKKISTNSILIIPEFTKDDEKKIDKIIEALEGDEKVLIININHLDDKRNDWEYLHYTTDFCKVYPKDPEIRNKIDKYGPYFRWYLSRK